MEPQPIADLKQTAGYFSNKNWVYSKVSKELQLGFCNCGELYASPLTAKRGELFWRWGEEARVGVAIGGAESSKYSGFSLAECDSFSLANLLPGNRSRSFFFLLSSALVGGGESFPFWLLGCFNCGFSLLMFTHQPTNQPVIVYISYRTSTMLTMVTNTEIKVVKQCSPRVSQVNTFITVVAGSRTITRSR